MIYWSEAGDAFAAHRHNDLPVGILREAVWPRATSLSSEPAAMGASRSSEPTIW